MLLTPHFSLGEMTRSRAAIDNCIINEATIEIQGHLKLLCVNILEPVREYFNAPVTVLSGYRGFLLNALVGGKDSSQHQTGEAADITINGVPNIDVFQYIRQNLPFDQLIAERLREDQPQSGWVHVSYCPKGRKDVLVFDGKSYKKWGENAGT